jgi:hypothetical protein
MGHLPPFHTLGSPLWPSIYSCCQEGAPPRKLALNRGDNPYLVADAFLEAEGLPAAFREQVVAFVTQNTGMAAGPTAGELASLPVTGGFCDPFTGGGSSSVVGGLSGRGEVGKGGRGCTQRFGSAVNSGTRAITTVAHRHRTWATVLACNTMHSSRTSGNSSVLLPSHTDPFKTLAGWRTEVRTTSCTAPQLLSLRQRAADGQARWQGRLLCTEGTLRIGSTCLQNGAGAGKTRALCSPKALCCVHHRVDICMLACGMAVWLVKWCRWRRRALETAVSLAWGQVELLELT